MNWSFVNRADKNYIKCDIDNPDILAKYRMKMLLEGPVIAALLKADSRTEDGNTAVYYEITAMQSLTKWFSRQKVTADFMKMMTACVRGATSGMGEYLLSTSDLVLDPEYVFVDIATGQLMFMYVPYYGKQNLAKLAQFLAEHADSIEERTAENLYNICADIERIEGGFSLETYVALWERYSGTSKEEEDSGNIPLSAESSPIQADSIPTAPAPVAPLDIARHKPLSIHTGDIAIKQESIMSKLKKLIKHSDPVDKQSHMPGIPAVNHAPAGAVSEDDMRTVYMEACPDADERKLYGNGRQNRNVIDLSSLPAVIGKKSGMVDVVLQDASISRMHARITEAGGSIFLEDLNSTNGTFHNNLRLAPYERVELLREDEVRLGKLSFTYR